MLATEKRRGPRPTELEDDGRGLGLAGFGGSAVIGWGQRVDWTAGWVGLSGESVVGGSWVVVVTLWTCKPESESAGAEDSSAGSHPSRRGAQYGRVE